MRYLLLVVLGAVAPAAAQENDWTLQRQLELPSHRSLIATLDGSGPAPFESDGCSGGLSIAWRRVAGAFPDLARVHEHRSPWESCCVVHDGAYHTASGARTAEESFAARLAADEALRSCVISKGRHRRHSVAEGYGVDVETVDRAYMALAEAMYLAVRFGGGPCTGLPWRWGYGFAHCAPISFSGQDGARRD